jgi:hypothetical protein
LIGSGCFTWIGRIKAIEINFSTLALGLLGESQDNLADSIDRVGHASGWIPKCLSVLELTPLYELQALAVPALHVDAVHLAASVPIHGIYMALFKSLNVNY